jgi:hypothetical protein
LLLTKDISSTMKCWKNGFMMPSNGSCRTPLLQGGSPW